MKYLIALASLLFSPMACAQVSTGYGDELEERSHRIFPMMSQESQRQQWMADHEQQWLANHEKKRSGNRYYPEAPCNPGDNCKPRGF
jgi:hypothetical protein